MKYILILLILVSCSHSECVEDKCIKNNDGESCYEAGVAVFKKSLNAKSEKEAKKIKFKAADFLGKGCDLGNQPSCYEFGRYQLILGYPLIGKEILEDSCRNDYELSCKELELRGLISEEKRIN